MPRIPGAWRTTPTPQYVKNSFNTLDKSLRNFILSITFLLVAIGTDGNVGDRFVKINRAYGASIDISKSWQIGRRNELLAILKGCIRSRLYQLAGHISPLELVLCCAVPTNVGL